MNEIILALCYLCLLAWSTFKYHRNLDDALKSFYFPALIVRIAAGTALGFVYFFHYGQGDTLTYWQDGNIIAREILSAPGKMLSFYWNDTEMPIGLTTEGPRSVFFVKVTGLLSLLTAGNYWIMAGLLSCLSFLGAWYLFKNAAACFPAFKIAAAAAFLWWPSIVFWSSGLVKESLAITCMFFLTGSILALMKNTRLSVVEWLLIFLSAWIGWSLKYYWFGIFFPVAFTTVVISVVKKSIARVVRWELSIWLLSFFLLLYGVTHLHPNFYPERFMDVIVENNGAFLDRSDAGNVIHFGRMEPTWETLAANIPMALWGGVFMPLPWQSHNALSLVASLENLLLLLLTLATVPELRSVPGSPHRLSILAGLVYITSMAVFLALSTPNLGTLSRYKIGFLPFLVFLILCGNPLLRSWQQKQR